MYRIVNTTDGKVIIVENNGKFEMYCGAHLRDYVGSIPTTELTNIDTPNDRELASLYDKHKVNQYSS